MLIVPKELTRKVGKAARLEGIMMKLRKAAILVTTTVVAFALVVFPTESTVVVDSWLARLQAGADVCVYWVRGLFM